MSIYRNSYEPMCQCLVMLLFNTPEIICSYLTHQEKDLRSTCPNSRLTSPAPKVFMEGKNFYRSLIIETYYTRNF